VSRPRFPASVAAFLAAVVCLALWVPAHGVTGGVTGNTAVVTGTVAVTQSTSPWVTQDSRLPTSLGQTTAANSLPVVFPLAAANAGAVRVTPDGVAFASFSNPLAVQVSADGTNAVSTSHPFLVQLSNGSASYSIPPTTTTPFSSLAAAGVLVKTGACTALGQDIVNNTPGTVYVQWFNRTTTAPDGTVPIIGGTGIASGNTPGPQNFGPYGVNFTTGCWMQLSSTFATMTAQASTAATGYVLFQ
jgi:hypothetical protein